ncbi:MAG: rhodanese-like domain-containing protein [Bacteroidales bacterium]|nr:rhodanese-like domain-containing protein [Bacteroidales bacterium]
MNVHDLNPKKTLITLVAFTLLLVIGFFTMNKPLLSYQLNLEQSLADLKLEEACFQPADLNAFLTQDSKDIILIDIRDRFSFGQGHIPGAKNISAYDLSQEENIELLNEYKMNKVTVVLYGNDQLQANGSWMLFRQVGFDNVKVLLGGYNYYLAHAKDLMASKDLTDYKLGSAKYDYAKLAQAKNEISSSSTTTKKKPIKIRRKKKKAVASGGC